MRVFRFMSNEEFNKYLAGEQLISTTDHREKYTFTESKGFCFFEYMDPDDEGLDGISPEYAYEFMTGIACMDVVAVFETDQELTKSRGRYADPYGSFFDAIWMEEYCTGEYDSKTFKLIKFGYVQEDEYGKPEAIWTVKTRGSS